VKKNKAQYTMPNAQCLMPHAGVGGFADSGGPLQLDRHDRIGRIDRQKRALESGNMVGENKVPPDDVPRKRIGEVRLFVPEHQGWTAAIKQGWSKEYCCLQRPGEDFYHLLVSGEIYLQRGTEKYCLDCSLRHGFATRERTYWQKETGATIAVSSEGISDH
jgi:hypothetical protein